MTSHQLSLCLSDERQVEPSQNRITPHKDWYEKILFALDVQESPTWPDDFGRALRSWTHSQEHQPIRTLSLFSGGGGFDIAFHDAGFDIVEMVEIEERYVATLRANSDDSTEAEPELGATRVRCMIFEIIGQEQVKIETAGRSLYNARL